MTTLAALSVRSDHIYAQCTRCSHFVLFRVVDLKIRYGDRMLVEVAEKRLRCANCGQRAARFTTTRPTANPTMLERFKIK